MRVCACARAGVRVRSDGRGRSEASCCACACLFAQACACAFVHGLRLVTVGALIVGPLVMCRTSSCREEKHRGTTPLSRRDTGGCSTVHHIATQHQMLQRDATRRPIGETPSMALCCSWTSRGTRSSPIAGSRPPPSAAPGPPTDAHAHTRAHTRTDARARALLHAHPPTRPRYCERPSWMANASAPHRGRQASTGARDLFRISRLNAPRCVHASRCTHHYVAIDCAWVGTRSALWRATSASRSCRMCSTTSSRRRSVGLSARRMRLRRRMPSATRETMPRAVRRSACADREIRALVRSAADLGVLTRCSRGALRYRRASARARACVRIASACSRAPAGARGREYAARCMERRRTLRGCSMWHGTGLPQAGLVLPSCRS
jgi:hypothetical protein